MALNKKEFSQGVLFFDGVCHLCNGVVDFLIQKKSLPPQVKFASLQSAAAQKLLGKKSSGEVDLSSVVWLEIGSNGEQQIYTQSDAILRVLESLGGIWRLVRIFYWIPLSWRDGLYRWIAVHRYDWFGKRETCRLPGLDEKNRFLD